MTTLRNSLLIIEQVIDLLPLGVFVIDIDQNICFFNKKAGMITDFEPEELLGTKCYKFARTASCSTRCCLRKALTDGKDLVSSRAIIRDKHGKKVPVNYNASLIRDEWGDPIGWIEAFVDERASMALESKPELPPVESFIGTDREIQRIVETLPVVAASGASVLICGETGCGKDVLAKLIHNSSPRANGPFVKVNSAALPDHLLESELFGYVKGAFTDAKRNKAGRFQLAHGGTIFLDEIGDLSLGLQAKLLQVLDEGEFYPLGATNAVKVDSRIIAATHRNLRDMVQEGRFREDLYFRLNVIEINVPPLRERPSDVPLFFEHFVQQFATLHGRQIRGTSSLLLGALSNYSFPGNIRELKNIVQHAVIMNRHGLIELSDCPNYFRVSLQQASHDIPDKVVQHASRKPLADERRRILEELSLHRWRIQETADSLKIDRTTLWRKMKKYSI